MRRVGQGCAELGGVRRHRAVAESARSRRNAPRSVRQTGRCVSHTPVGAASAHRQRAARARLGHLEAFQGPRRPRADDVRPDDGRSWTYIGTQGILQGTYETLAALARRHFGGTLRGRLTVTAGLGGMGGAQPLAVTMNEGVALVVEVDAARIRRRLDTRYSSRRPIRSTTPSRARAYTASAARRGRSASKRTRPTSFRPSWRAGDAGRAHRPRPPRTMR